MPPRRSIADPALLTALTTRINRVTPDRQRIWGTIDAHQMVAHLVEVADAVLLGMPFRTQRRPSRLIRIVALHLPLTWPRGIKSGVEPATLVVTPERFDMDRLQAVSTLERLAGAREGSLMEQHPIFGAMTLADWHRWAYLHTDHHLRQFGV